jgi:Tol biopolymer transport system component
MDIWVKQLDRGPSIRLTREQVFNDLPAWTPDGKSVTFLSLKDTSSFAYWTGRADGSTPPSLQVPVTITDPRPVSLKTYMPVWSPDGRWLLYSTDATGADSGSIVGIRPGLDTAAIGIVATNNQQTAPAVSPDGRWLAYVSNETGHYEVYVVPFPNTHAAKWAISTHGGGDPQWSPRGNELFYRDDAGNFMAVEVKTKPTFSVQRTTVLFSTSRLSMFRAKRYAVAPDARRFLMIQSAEGGPEKLVVVDNWFEEMKAKAN